jgi:antitoxin MazE
VKSRIVNIGNSCGVRIPKPLIQEAGLGEEVEIQVEGNRLIIAPAGSARADWAAPFREMARTGADALIDGDVLVPSKWEEDEWEWD